MRPFLFLISIFGILYLIYIWIESLWYGVPQGSEVSFFATIAYSIFGFFRWVDSNINPISFNQFYYASLGFFSLVFVILFMYAWLAEK